MAGLVSKFYRSFLVLFALPVLLSDYLDTETGRDYGLGFARKLMLAWRMARNNLRITGASSFLEHLVMATQILRVPKSVAGCVVECGSYKGRSAANLSLACALCNRALEVFDSFEGLPEPSDADKVHTLVGAREFHTYARGAWYGTLEEVKRNIARWGQIGVCSFHAGYFDRTLPLFGKRCVLAFVDVDLRDSLETCLRLLWPMLEDGCYFFTHEAPHMEVASLFFDRNWWCSALNCEPPGLVGAGNGLGLLPRDGGFASDLGYTVKSPRSASFAVKPQTGASGGAS